MNCEAIRNAIDFILAQGVDPFLTLRSLSVYSTEDGHAFSVEVETLIEEGGGLITLDQTVEEVLVVAKAWTQTADTVVPEAVLPDSLLQRLQRQPKSGKVDAPSFRDPIYVQSLQDLIARLKPVSEQMPCLEASLAVVKLEEALIWLNLCLAKRVVPGLVSFETQNA